LLWLLAAGLGVFPVAHAQVWISEVLFNPPSTDSPHEYIELRGAPNYVLSNGTYFVAVEGDTNGNPGTVQTVFDLSGRALGGNGFLVLLQNSNSYALNTNCFALINSVGAGFGFPTNAPRHRGEGGQTDLENGSSTFFLIRTTNAPTINADIDANNDGTPDGPDYASWTVYDAVAVLDNDGLGDIGYGKINFRRSTAPGNGATVASGTIVSVNFTPAYVGRTGHTTNWAASSWVAGDGLDGAAPNWTLDSTDTEPLSFANRPLAHVGGPNFGATNIPGVVARESGFSTDFVEGTPSVDTYTLGLNTMPAGNVTVRINAAAQAQISIDNGASFGATRTVVFSNTSPILVLVRITDDNVVDASPHAVPIAHTITASGDAANYPVTSLTPVVNARVIENDSALLSELKVNPPGPEDAPFEFVEIRGAANATLTNLYLLAIEGNKDSNRGVVNLALNLSGAQLGSSGLLLVVADGHPYSVPGGARVFLVSEFGEPGGALANSSATFLLASSSAPLAQQADFDAGDNGTLEGLPLGVTILDSVGWSDGDGGDRVYTTANLVSASGTPDAATRIVGNTNANAASAWVFGDLEGDQGSSLVYEEGSTVPYGTQLSPGSVNNTAPKISGLTAFSSVIGDPTTPILQFQISDAESPVSSLTVTVVSDNQAVVPNANLVLGGSGSNRTLSITPTGVGYATILISVSDGAIVGLKPLPYAASADPRGGGRFHTGVSDASAALALDSNFMFVGDDENQILRLFSRSNSGPALAAFNMNPFLQLDDLYPDGTPREIDLEGATRVGNRLFWIGSHSHNRDFEVRTNRGRIFTTDLTGSGTNATLTYVGRYDYLKLDLLNWDATNGHGKGSNYYGLVASGAPGIDPKAPDGSGFNIEGLTMAPGSTTTAYVCFRAPLIPATNRVKALVVPVTNFAALAATNSTNTGLAQFGAPIELNLGGRGVRSMEGGPNGFLLVAGPPGIAVGQPPSDFRLFTWTGLAANQPQERGASLTNLIPEAIVELPPGPWTSGSSVQIISDNGITDYYGDGLQAKFLSVREFKKFRSDRITFGPVVTPQPVIREVALVGGNCRITWYSVAGLTYRVQFKSSLSDATWTDVAGDVTATDALASKSIAISGTARFFRVIIP